jgi:copper(I)-binding protein
MTVSLDRRMLLTLLLAPAFARAHEGLHAMGVGVAVHGAKKTDGGKLEVGLTLTNTTGADVTLRGVACDQAKSARLLGRKSLFGVESWSEVKILRLDDGDEVALTRPDYVIEIAGAPEDEDLLNLRLDFGPAGERTVVVFVTD